MKAPHYQPSQAMAAIVIGGILNPRMSSFAQTNTSTLLSTAQLLSTYLTPVPESIPQFTKSSQNESYTKGSHLRQA